MVGLPPAELQIERDTIFEIHENTERSSWLIGPYRSRDPYGSS